MTPQQSQRRGLWLGFLGVVIFAATLPMTKLAVGSADAPQLSPWFVTFGRAAVAGSLSLIYLTIEYWRGVRVIPTGTQWVLLLTTASAVVVGFPLFMSLALQYVPSTHGAVVTGLLPLSTALVAALWFKQKPSLGFWLCALTGTALVLLYMGLRSADSSGHLSLHLADVFLLIAMTSAAVGYVSGARLTPSLGAERVICWVLVVSLPITLPLMWFNAPFAASAAASALDMAAAGTTATPQGIRPSSWWGFAYVAVFSMWIGFFAWYRGLALGGAVRVSQVQLVQPFFSLVFAVPLLGETLDVMTIAFGLAVIAVVFVGKKMPVGVAKSDAAAHGRPSLGATNIKSGK